MREDAIARRQQMSAEAKTRLDPLAAALTDAALASATAAATNAPRDSWAFCLTKLAAPELGIPQNYSVMLRVHPAVQRALQLVGAISTASTVLFAAP